MSKVKLYRETRDGVICLRFSHASTHADKRTAVTVNDDQWDGSVVVNHNQAKSLNTMLASLLAQCQVELMHIISTEPTRRLSAADLRDKVCVTIFGEEDKKENLFFETFYKFAHDSSHRASTKTVYMSTYNMLKKYDPKASFEKINVAYLKSLTEWMTKQGMSTNYRSKHQRNIRAVFNYAIDNDITSCYPFRKFSCERADVNSRDLDVFQLRALFGFCGTIYQERYIDLFKLQFYLIGINMADLFHLKPSDYSRGRIQYVRAKTGKKYNIKVEPEAAAIINKYKGTGDHLLAMFDANGETHNAFMHNYNNKLRVIAGQLGLRIRLTTYVTRYTWASLAYNDLGLPMDTISQALGHSFGLKVTQGYINAHNKKVDEANRAVIDYVNGK